MQHNWEPCFLLHARSFGDTSIIADVFTESSGKVSIIAKGAKNPRSKFFGHLLPFSALKIIVTGKSEMKTLTQIDSNFVSQSVKLPDFFILHVKVMQVQSKQSFAILLVQLIKEQSLQFLLLLESHLSQILILLVYSKEILMNHPPVLSLDQDT